MTSASIERLRRLSQPYGGGDMLVLSATGGNLELAKLAQDVAPNDVVVYLIERPVYTAPEQALSLALSNFNPPNVFTPAPPPVRICGVCGNRGKCISKNGHRGKHEAISGFRW